MAQPDAVRRTLWLLVAANAVPVLGVLFFGWRLGEVLFLFWLESGIVGFYGILRMALVARWRALGLVPFFVLHYGWFMFGHLFLVALVIGWEAGQAPDLRALLWACAPAAVVLAGSHGASFVQHVLREGERRTPEQEMMAPYGRIALQHVTLMAGGVLTVAAGAPKAALVLIVGAKTAVDAWVHVRRHRRAQRGPASLPAAPGTGDEGARA